MPLLHPLAVRHVAELNPGELARVRLFSGLALVIAAQGEDGERKLVSLDRGPPNREELRRRLRVHGMQDGFDAALMFELTSGKLLTLASDQTRAFFVQSWSLVRRSEHPAAPLEVLFSFEGA